MECLTKQELYSVFSWLPYREDWPVDRNQKEDGIIDYYGILINRLIENELFDSYYSEDGGMGNYLEFLNGNKLKLIDREFANRPLPDTIVNNLERENHNEGNQYLHGFFQKTD